MIFLIIVFGVAFVVLAAALGIWWAAASNAEREFEQSVQAWHRAGGGDIDGVPAGYLHPRGLAP